MRRSVAVTLVVLVGCGAGTVAQLEFDAEQAMRYVEAQLAFGPRVPNTPGHRNTGDWIHQQLQERVDAVEVQEFVHVTVEGDTLRLRNFIGRFRPDLVDRILYVAHWDTRPRSDQSSNVGDQQRPVPGANDGAASVALLLGVADVLSEHPSDFGVDLLFVDGEDYGDFGMRDDVLIGSRYYAANLDTTRLPLFAVVWDMIADQDPVFFKEGHSVRRAPEVVERVWNRANELGYGKVFRTTMGSAITDDHVPLLDAGIRAIDVIDLDYDAWHTPEDTIDKLSQETLQLVGNVAVALLR